MREVVLDTETTGLDPFEGHRLVEIGCIELINRLPTGRVFHTLINPERDMPIEAFRIHGLSAELLSVEKPFRELYQDFLDFIGLDTPLVIHNARFDMKFLNAELDMLKLSPLPFTRAVDTMKIAREKFPGSPYSLDALCKKFKVDNSKRQKHGALLDAELLAQVYLELMGGRQDSLLLHPEKNDSVPQESSTVVKTINFTPRLKRVFTPGEEEKQNHQTFLQKLKNPVWLQ